MNENTQEPFDPRQYFLSTPKSSDSLIHGSLPDDDRPTITWTLPKALRFKRAYLRASQEEGSDGVFLFEGHEFVVGYAKYLLRYLEMKWGITIL
jgi:hypothetical protein